MRFGLFSNGLRRNKVAADTYREDLYEIQVADELGFDEAWVSEHIGGFRPDSQPCPDLFICQAAALTQRIRLGPAVRLLPLYHPLNVATQAAVCDHLTGGRYLFGFGSGVPFFGNMEQRNLTNDDRHPMVMEAIEYILRAWTADAPFDWEGPRWPGRGIRIVPRTLQQPHMPIAVASGHDDLLQMAGQRGWQVLIGQYAGAAQIAETADKHAAAAAAAGRPADRAPIAVARHIHISDSVEQAKAEWRETVSVDIEDWKRHLPNHFRYYLPPSGRVEDVNFDQLVEAGAWIAGDPDTVYEQLKAQYDAAGGFGMLLVVMGKDWATRELRARSLRLFAEHVMPRLAALPSTAPSAQPAAQAAPTR